MLGGGAVEVNNPNPSAGFQSRGEVVEKRVGLCHLVVHVYEDSYVERSGRQARIVRFAERYIDIGQL